MGLLSTPMSKSLCEKTQKKHKYGRITKNHEILKNVSMKNCSMKELKPESKKTKTAGNIAFSFPRKRMETIINVTKLQIDRNKNTNRQVPKIIFFENKCFQSDEALGIS